MRELASLMLMLKHACMSSQGMLRGYDQTNNLVIEDCHERVFSAKVIGDP